MNYLLNLLFLVAAALPDVEHDVAGEGGSLVLLITVVGHELFGNQALALLQVGVRNLWARSVACFKFSCMHLVSE